MKEESNNIENNKTIKEFQVTLYNSILSPKVESKINLSQAVKMLQTGDKYLTEIENARSYGKGTDEYDAIKTKKLPTFRFNFLFREKACNSNITGPTGLIYLDVDYADTVPASDYILASWRSLSNTGYGVLVKVENLTVNNFKAVYDQISEEIGIKADAGARKAIQQTVLSFDNGLFYNPNSTTFTYQETKKVSSPIKEREKKGIEVNETFCPPTYFKVARFDDIDDFFKGENADKPYLFFAEEKAAICQPFIPMRIGEGSRNSTMFAILTNYAALNPNLGFKFLKGCSDTINKNTFPPLSELEIKTIINNILRMRVDRADKVSHFRRMKLSIAK